MLYPVQRLLKLFVLLFFIFLSSGKVFAITSDYHAQSAEALAHCTAQSTAAAAANANPMTPVACSIGSGTSGYVGRYLCKIKLNSNQVNYNCSQATGQSNIAVDNHYYAAVTPPCEAEVGDQIESYWGGAHGTVEAPASVCQSQCNYNYVESSTHDCQETAPGPSHWECASYYAHDGEECDPGEDDVVDSAGGNQYDCTNVDCSTDPDSGGGSGEEGGGNEVPDQDNPNEPADPDDGNPDTPGTPGSGYGGGGDIDGDGDRDIDCDPQSNPDCSYTGSGVGSGNCDVQPACSGDPVACAILYQEWASMCYDGAEFSNPSNCQIELECEGDVLLCEIIRQERQQYCDAYVGDGTQDLDPTNNTDFDRDLKDEADEVELPDAFNMAGLGSGSCPADFPINTSLGTVSVSFQSACDMAPIIRIFVILSALMGAVFIVVGGGRDKGVT